MNLKKPSRKPVKNSKAKTSINIHDEFFWAVFVYIEIIIEFFKLYIGRTLVGRQLLQ